MRLEELEPKRLVGLTGIIFGMLPNLIQDTRLVFGLHQLLHICREEQLREYKYGCLSKYVKWCEKKVHQMTLCFGLTG